LAVYLAAAGLAWAPDAALGQEDGPARAGGERRPDAESLLRVLTDASAEPSSRDAAADRLVEASQRPEVARLLAGVLEGAGAPGAATILLGAVARTWDVPSRLARVLLDGAPRATAELLPAHLLAIAAIRSPEAARTLVRYLATDQPAAVRAAAFEGLSRMTGRDDLGTEPGAWQGWLERARGASGASWDALLAEGVWRRTLRLEADRRIVADRLTDGYRRLYLALPPPPAPDRGRLLSQMLLGARPELRDLGFEIVSREVAGGNAVDGPVAEAGLRLIQSTDAAVRSKAAGLVMQTAGPDAAHHLAAALAIESDGDAAAQMLGGLARWPDREALGPMIRWLASPGTAPAAAEALLALEREELVADAADRARIVSALRLIQPARLTPAECRLLAACGEATDQATVANLLTGPAGPLRVAAAESLAPGTAFTDRILAAAQHDPALFNAAVSALGAGGPTADGYATLQMLPAPSPEERREGLLRLAAGLSVADLVAVAESQSDPAMRIALLSRLTEHSAALPSARDAPDEGALVRGLLLLVQTQLAAKRPDLALSALDALPDPMPAPPAGASAESILSLRAMALIWSNRIREAAELNAPAAAWLDGLERAIGEPHAKAILNAIRARFSSTLTPEEIDRLQRLAARLSSQGAPEGHASAPDPTAPPK
jgi:hypothetical protein